MEDRQEEIEAIQKQYPMLYPLSLGVALVLFGVWLGGIVFRDWEGYAINVYTSILGIGVSVFILDKLAQQRERKREQKRLVSEAKSSSNDVAKRAVELLRENGWLIGEDSLLKNADLVGANLAGARLASANLEKAKLSFADLRDAELEGAQMQGASLESADLRGADLEVTDLSEAVLYDADLRGAFLEHTDFFKAMLRYADLRKSYLSWVTLQGADLSNAKLQGAEIHGDRFDEETILPDGTRWTPDADLRRFT